MPDTCPLSARVAAGLAAPGAKLDAELGAHLPRCEACRCAVSDALRRWPAESAPLAEWLRDGTNLTTITPFQADALARGAPNELELGPYLVLDLIARGGMGAVYRAWHLLLRREDAVKTVRAEFAASSEAVRRFLREAEAAARRRHANVVQVYTADRAGGQFYIAMEFVNGPDLSRVVRDRGPLPPDVARDYVAQAADGLQHALDLGFVHRDIKPANLLLAPGGVVKVADFGLARALDPLRDDGNPTVPGAIMGTPAYMAPEQARGERADTRADVYALGCTLFFLLTGRTPFHAAQGIQLLYAHLHEPVPEVPAPPALAAVARKCLAKRADDRYQTPGELAAALRALGAPLADTVVRPGAPIARADSTAPPAADSTSGSTESFVAPLPLPADEPRGPRPKVIIAVAALLLLVATVAFVVLMVLPPNPNSNAGGNTKPVPVVPKPVPIPGPNVGARPNIDAKRVPAPEAKKPTPWKVVALVPAQDKEKVTAVGFLPNGEIVIARGGAKDDGSDSAWEVWAAAPGAAPLRFRNPVSLNPYAKAVLVTDRALLTDRFERINPVTLNGMEAFPHGLETVDRGFAQTIDSAALSGDGKYVAAGLTPEGDGRDIRIVLFWSTETLEQRSPAQIQTKSDLHALATDRKGEVLIAGTKEGVVERVTTSGENRRKWAVPKVNGKPDAVSAAAVTPDGTRAFSAHPESGAVYGWDHTKPDPVQKIDLGWPVYRMCVSPDGRWLVAAGDAVAAIDLSTNPPEVHTLAEHYAGELRCAAFSADGKRLIVGGWALRALPKDGVGVAWVWELK